MTEPDVLVLPPSAVTQSTEYSTFLPFTFCSKSVISDNNDIGEDNVNRSNQHFYNIGSLNAISKTKNLEKPLKSAFKRRKVEDRYKLQKAIGSGSFATVFAATDTVNNETVAIKNMSTMLLNNRDIKRALREIIALHLLKQHPNIVQLKRVCRLSNNKYKLCLVMEHMDTDLYRIIHSDQHFTHDHIKLFMYQILSAVAYMHSINIIHRDLTLRNILINQDCLIKLADFGMCRYIGNMDNNSIDLINKTQDTAQAQVTQDTTEVIQDIFKIKQDISQGIQAVPNSIQDMPQVSQMTTSKGSPTTSKKHKRTFTNHVVTRYYRAPEIVLLTNSQTTAVDMWSVGCIFFEMMQMLPESNCTFQERQELFKSDTCFPLSNCCCRTTVNDVCICENQELNYTRETDHLNVVCDILGTPNKTRLDWIDNPMSKNYILNLQAKQPNLNLQSNLRTFMGTDAIDLLDKLLQFDPTKRISAVEALNHPYLKSMVNSDVLLKNQQFGADELEQVFDFEDQYVDSTYLLKIIEAYKS